MVQQSEAKFVNDWMKINHPNVLQWSRVRLGLLPEGGIGKMMNVTQRYADKIFLEDDTLFIVEAKLRKQVGAIAQLELYKQLLPDTPEFSSLKGYPIRLILLAPRKDPDLVQMCEAREIAYEIYTPNWVIASLEESSTG